MLSSALNWIRLELCPDLFDSSESLATLIPENRLEIKNTILNLFLFFLVINLPRNFISVKSCLERDVRSIEMLVPPDLEVEFRREMRFIRQPFSITDINDSFLIRTTLLTNRCLPKSSHKNCDKMYENKNSLKK